MSLELTALNWSSHNANPTLHLNGNITLTSNTTFIDLGSGSLNGNGYTITVDSTQSNGLFKLYGGSILNVKLDFSATTSLTQFSSMLIAYDGTITSDRQYSDISYVDILGG